VQTLYTEISTKYTTLVMLATPANFATPLAIFFKVFFSPEKKSRFLQHLSQAIDKSQVRISAKKSTPFCASAHTGIYAIRQFAS
jgi:hypothetical protein